MVRRQLLITARKLRTEVKTAMKNGSGCKDCMIIADFMVVSICILMAMGNMYVCVNVWAYNICVVCYFHCIMKPDEFIYITI